MKVLDIIMAVHLAVNAVPYVPDRPNAEQWQGVAHFVKHGGDCEDYAYTKCGLLAQRGIDCRVVMGRLDDGRGHAVALVEGKYWLDNRKAYAGSFEKPSDFNQTKGE